MSFNYQEKGAPKLTEEFKKEFVVKIQNRVDTIKVDGLIAFAHEKGIKDMRTTITQYPSQDNQWTCIAQTIVIGFDWNPATEKIEEVTFSDFADANPANCTAMTKSSYIRMASTRSVGRALRKYTNINMVTKEEISNSIDEHLPPIEEISTASLTEIQSLVRTKKITPQEFTQMMFTQFQHTNYMGLSEPQGKLLIGALKAYKPKPTQEEPAKEQAKSTPSTQV